MGLTRYKLYAGDIIAINLKFIFFTLLNLRLHFSHFMIESKVRSRKQLSKLVYYLRSIHLTIASLK
jgi:hypothetical protein